MRLDGDRLTIKAGKAVLTLKPPADKPQPRRHGQGLVGPSEVQHLTLALLQVLHQGRGGLQGPLGHGPRD